MSWLIPAALWGLLLIPALIALHLGARPRGDRAFSAFLLLRRAALEGVGARRLRAPLLLAARLAALIALTLALAAPFVEGEGTLILAAGPIHHAPWPTPHTVVRAGHPPTLEARPAPVLGPPNWSGALLLGQRQAPEAAVVRVAAPKDPTGGIRAAGAALHGGEVIVTATVKGSGAPWLEAEGRRYPLTARAHDWIYRGALPPGPAEIRLGQGRWPICLPDARPLQAQEGAWPPEARAVLDALGVEWVARGGAWRLGPPPRRAEGWPAFAPPVTYLSFAEGLPSEPTPVWFSEPLPAPGAVLHRFTPLPDPGAPLLFAGDAVIVDLLEGPEGRARRFGFNPRDGDLPDTAGWPVLFHDMVEADRAARVPCRIHPAARPLPIAASAAVRVTAPSGRIREHAPTEGRVVLNGLDELGHFELESGGRRAYVAVVPPHEIPEEGGAAEAEAWRPPPRTIEPDRAPLALLALLALSCAAFLRRRRPYALIIAAGVAAVAAWAPRLGAGEAGPVVLAIDTSGSINPQRAQAAAEALTEGLEGQRVLRVEGDDRVRRAAPLDARPLAPAGGPTKHGPLLEAAEILAGEAGVIVLLSDGRAPDGPIQAARPVFTLGVDRGGVDARVEGGRAVRLGGSIFVHALISADAPTDAVVQIGEQRRAIRLAPRRRVRAVLPAGPEAVTVTVESPEDPVPENDRWPLAVEGSARGEALVVGEGALPWARAAGLEALPIGPGALGGAAGRPVRALFIHDQPADALPPLALQHLPRWVEAGGVLILSGRADAFGPGGWAGTPLDALSPLNATPRPPEDTLALLLLLDRSGSMSAEAGGLGAARIGALSAALVAGLRARDQVGILAFGAGVEPLLELGPVEGLDGRLPTPRWVRGGTQIGPALLAAAERIQGAHADRAAVALITDGRFTDAGEIEAAVEALAATRARLIVIAPPDANMEGLSALAARLDGVVLPEGARLPSRLRAALSGAGEALLIDGGPARPGAAWSTRVGGSPPTVARRVRVSAKPGGRVLARVDGDPLLAEWAHGRGRVIALATDAWGLDEAQWGGLLAPASAPRLGDGQLVRRGNALRYEDAPTAPLPVGPLRVDGHALRWRPIGPGVATAPLPEGPVALLEVESPSRHGRVRARITRPPPPELSATGVDEARLEAQARLTGGARLAGVTDRSFLAARGRVGRFDLTPWLLLGALLLLLGDAVAWRGGRLSLRRRRRA